MHLQLSLGIPRSLNRPPVRHSPRNLPSTLVPEPLPELLRRDIASSHIRVRRMLISGQVLPHTLAHEETR
jgi:hypothetical protein